jgi:hypothetical protein
MTVPADRGDGPEPGGVCTLCGARIGAGADRCPACGLVPTGRTTFGWGAVWVLGAIFVAVYLVTVAVVAAAR